MIYPILICLKHGAVPFFCHNRIPESIVLAIPAVKSCLSVNSKKSKRQKKYHRKTTLMKKVSEYSKMCEQMCT